MCYTTNRYRFWLAIFSLCFVAYAPSDINAQSNDEGNINSNINNSSNNSEDKRWELVKVDTEQGITIYYRSLPTGNIEFKGVAQIKSTLSSIIAVFLDFQSMPHWLYRTQKVTLLERLNARELYIYTIHTMPFPFRNRDSVDLIQLTQTPSTKMITIDVRNAPDYIQHNEDYVRVPVAVSQWQLLPLANDRVKIIFTGYGEPGGSVSSDAYRSSLFQWLVKQFLWKVPYKSLLGLKDHVSREKYQNRRYDFIKELNDR